MRYPRVCLLVTAWAVLLVASGLPAADNPVERVVHATFKVSGKDSTSTCFLVSRPGAAGAGETILVTAGHTFERMTGDEAKLILREKDGEVYKRKDQTVKVRAGGKPLWVKHPQADVAALRVEVTAAVAAKALPLERVAGEAAFRGGRVAPGEDIWVVCFPAQFEANGAGFPVTRKGAVAGYPLAPVATHRTFLLDYNTFNGDSGGPVLIVERGGDGKRKEPLIIGLITAQVRHDERVTLVYEERVLHHRLGLAIAVPAEFIRQAIEQVPRAAPALKPAAAPAK